MVDIQIGMKTIGDNHPAYIIAEAGINHDGKFGQAIELINVAANAGCDAIKFQLFKAKEMYIPNPGEYLTASGEKTNIYNLVEKMELPKNWIPNLITHSKSQGLEFLCTTCDIDSTNILDNLGMKMFKLSSYDLTHLPLIKHAAKKGKPIIFSTAAGTISEVDEAYESILSQGNHKIAIMHCVGQYPASPENSNLKIIKTLKYVFPDAIIGFSDHSQETKTVPCAAINLGAKILEKHITIDKKLDGPDHCFALDPDELKEMVSAIKDTENNILSNKDLKIDPTILGSSRRKTNCEEKYARSFSYRSIVAAKTIKKGDLLDKDNLTILRSGEKKQGISPKYLELIFDKKVRSNTDIITGDGLLWEYILNK
jgi:sialic acid synthase SpsE